MWIERDKKDKFIRILTSLSRQVLVVRGARQVGKTSFIEKCLDELSDFPIIRLNLLYRTSMTLSGKTYLGREFLGQNPSGETFLQNLQNHLNQSLWKNESADFAQRNPSADIQKPFIVFMDEADRHPLALEMIQTLAEFTDRFKVVISGSNLENIRVSNAATGRKCFFDLYPIHFFEFLKARSLAELLAYIQAFNPEKIRYSEYYHEKLMEQFEIFLRLGGMPRILATFLDAGEGVRTIPELVNDLVFSIEENVKTVLDHKSKLYEYLDVLRTLATLSLNTLKYSRLQVQHAGQREAKRLVMKTVGARVAHKIRLFDDDRDLSKYILFDTGIANYLLNGSDVLKNQISEKHRAILLETFVGNEIIQALTTRDDVYYWKSGNQAEIEFFLQTPCTFGIDVKSQRSGDHKSLSSLALFEEKVACLVTLGMDRPRFVRDYLAKLPNHAKTRRLPLFILPIYYAGYLRTILEKSNLKQI